MFRYLLFPIESLQLCLLLYFAVIISCRIILWFGSDTYFLHFSCWVPSALCLRLYLPRTSVVFTLFFDCDTILTSSCWVLSAVCVLLYLAVIVSCILWVCFGTYFFLLKPFSCVYFFTLPWSSATASFCDLDPILTLFLLSPFGFVFTSLLCFDHQLHSRRSLIVYRHLLLPVASCQLCVYFFTLQWSSVAFASFSDCDTILTSFTFASWIPSTLCLRLYFALIISCISVVLWLCIGTYVFLLRPFSCAFTSLLCSDRQLRLLHSLIVIRYLLLSLLLLGSLQLCLDLYFALIISCIRVVIWLCIGTYVFLLRPFSCAFTSLLCSDRQLRLLHSLIVIRYLLLSLLLLGSLQLCLDLYFALIISCILWLCFGTYFFLLNPFSCVYFFTLPWLSATASFCDLDPILTSYTFPVESLRLCAYFFALLWSSVTFASFFDCDTILTSFHFTSWIPSVRLCFILYLFLSLTFSCWIPSAVLSSLIYRELQLPLHF